jgi:hypothetical protein
MKKGEGFMNKYSKEGIVVNNNQRRMTIIETHISTRPSTFKQQRSYNHDEGINKREDHDQPR